MSFDKSTLQLEASASVDADVCVGRCGCLRRSVRMSASVGADVCVGRCGTCLITLLASTNNNKNRKEQNFDIEVLLFSLVGCKWSTWLGHFKGVHLSQVHQPNRMLVNMVGVPLHGWCSSTWLMQFYMVDAPLLGWCTSTRLMHFYMVDAPLHGWCTSTWLVHLRQVHPLKLL